MIKHQSGPVSTTNTTNSNNNNSSSSGNNDWNDFDLSIPFQRVTTEVI